MRKTLYDITRKLKQNNERWLLAGRTAAVLQGAMIQAHKLTLYSNQVTAYKFNEYFQEYRSLKVKYRTSTPLSGHAGTFNINGVEVSIVGDPEIVHSGKHHFLPIDLLLEKIEDYQLEDIDVPLLPNVWLMLLGILGEDKEMVQSLIETGISKQDVLTTAQDLGLAFHIRPLVDSAYQK